MATQFHDFHATRQPVAADLVRLAIPVLVVAVLIAGALWLDHTTFFIVEAPEQAAVE